MPSGCGEEILCATQADAKPLSLGPKRFWAITEGVGAKSAWKKREQRFVK